jgi:hypothetical protein
VSAYDIRPLERGDLPQVSRVIQLALPTSRPLSEPEQVAWLERTLLEQPWADPEIASLVCATSSGEVVGFIGAASRRMRLDREPIRAAYAVHLSTRPDLASGAMGGLLLRRFLAGRQDLSVGDTASARVRAMWEAAGGETSEGGSISWFKLFRPVRAGVSMSDAFGSWGARAGRLASAVVGPADGRPRRAPPAPELPDPMRAEALTPAALVEAMPAVMRRRRLVPDYDEAYLEWLFRALDEEPRGAVVARLLRQGEEPVGWYVFRLVVNGMSRALEVAARPGRMDDVVDALMRDARASGAAALRGRLDPGMMEAVASRRCLYHVGHRLIVHSRRADVMDAVRSRSAAFSRLLGEWW